MLGRMGAEGRQNEAAVEARVRLLKEQRWGKEERSERAEKANEIKSARMEENVCTGVRETEEGKFWEKKGLQVGRLKQGEREIGRKEEDKWVE